MILVFGALLTIWGVFLVAVLRMEANRNRAWWARDYESNLTPQDDREYQAIAEELHEAGHPDDLLRYDITRPVSLPEPWDVVPSECRASCYRDDEITHD